MLLYRKKKLKKNITNYIDFIGKEMILFLGRRGRYEKLILISSLVLAVGLGVGCSNEETKKTDEPKKKLCRKKRN